MDEAAEVTPGAPVAALGEEILRTVLAIASSVFDQEVTADDNFFDVGGDSVHAIEFGLRIKERLGVEIDPALLVSVADFVEFAAALATR